MTAEQREELEAMKEQEQEEQLEKSREPVEAVMKKIREMGRLPKESRGASEEERSLAEKLRDHKKRGNLSEEHKAELAAMSFKELGELEEVRLEGDPMDPFHEEAANRFEQDLLMASNGIRPKHVMRRIARYKKYMTHPCALGMDLVQKYKEQVLEAESEQESEDGDLKGRTIPALEFVDMGAAVNDNDDADVEEVPLGEKSSYPLTDIKITMALCLQKGELESLDTKRRKGQGDLALKALDETYTSLLRQDFSLKAAERQFEPHGFPENYSHMIALQKQTIALAKKQLSAEDVLDEEELKDCPMPSGASQPAEPEWVPLPLAMRGPSAVALQLLKDASCTEEQIDAVALLALSMQKRFEARQEKSSPMLPVATPSNNHRAVWLGGGGVGKTRTLSLVVRPLAETFFGRDGYCATAQSNQAAQNLGSKGRTLHSANGLLMTDSLQTARLRLNPQTQKKMDRLVGSLGVDVIDELGTVPADLLHADALRKTYGRCRRHSLDTTMYMKPAETWGRMPCKILSGDFYQLPPVPATKSLLPKPENPSYEHVQGRKLLMDMEYVVDFVEMKRFEDPLLVEVLEAMRTPGGKKISENAWEAIKATQIKKGEEDKRLREARNWYECAYEWRLVSYAMHAHARLNAKAAGRLLYYIPAIDAPSARMNQQDYEDMRAQPNISTSAKLPGILPVYIGMEMILTESYLPPRIVRGAPVTVVDIELHPQEPPIATRDSIASHGCVVLQYMPKCVYVRLENCEDQFLASADGASQPGCVDLRGVIAVQPVCRTWRYKGKKMEASISVSRTQTPLLPRKQCTLHGVQGKTGDPGFIAHWTFPVGISVDNKWLGYYVSLSRPRSFSRLLSHGLPDREIIEGGPPKNITEAFDELFSKKIVATKKACADARREMKWPARPG